jgi:hypothetical protein
MAHEKSIYKLMILNLPLWVRNYQNIMYFTGRDRFKLLLFIKIKHQGEVYFIILFRISCKTNK